MNRLTKGKGLFGVLATTQLQIGSGATMRGVNYGTLNAVHGTILPGGIGTVNTALAGVAATDIVTPNILTPTAGLVLTGVKPGAGTLTAYLTNPTSGTVQPGTFSMTYAHLDLTA
jgi:hypothetical protein